MKLDILKNKIKNNEIDEATKMVSEIGKSGFKAATEDLIKYLEETTSSKLRNAIAIALSDLGAQDSIVPIMKLLKDPKTLGNRGTLLYALEAFDCTSYFDDIIEFLFVDNFEVSHQSLSLIESSVKQIDSKALDRYNSKIKAEINKAEEKIEFLSDALELLSKIKVRE
ncbi:MAG: HEAT repeat domain-containing protein [Bacillota bacterium]|nr:HEAT repeat domain-containing protein [Bacillota bacterium]